MKQDKLLRAIKNNIAKKEKTLKTIHEKHPHLKHLSETQILAYFDIISLDELSALRRNIKKSTLFDDNIIDEDYSICSCTNNQGQAKDLYASEESAQKKATVFIGQKKLELKVYVCPSGCGWHLTKG
ncbi:hypothetical protein [Sulfurovum sp.]|uniref:hypothetical protein n=1 Tax=Sulfurovum sp. TaxID=1969726 RepID=UPI002867D18C|nr:hypothetical protein [Sulfurovum sp.]